MGYWGVVREVQGDEYFRVQEKRKYSGCNLFTVQRTGNTIADYERFERGTKVREVSPV